MAQNINSLQLLRSNAISANKAAAVAALNALAAGSTPSNLDGVAALARYDAGNGEVKSVVGFGFQSGNTRSMTIMDFDSTQIAAMQTEIDAIETGVGLNADGTHAQSAGNYTSGASSIEGEIVALDTQVKTNTDAIAAINTAISGMDASSVAEENSVITDVTEADGVITATPSLLTGVKLSGLSATANTKIAETQTLGQALGNLQGQIDSMDLAAVGTGGSVITGVAEADGKVSASATPLVDITLTGFESGTTEGDIDANDTVEEALNKLQNNIKASASATSVKNTDGSINVTLPTDSESGTTIDVNIKTGEHVLAKDGNAGLYTDIKLSAVTPSSTAVKEEYSLIGTDGTALGENIKIYKDSSVVSIRYITDTGDTHYQNLEYQYIDASGNTQTEYVDMSTLILEAEFASGVTVDASGVAHGVVDPDSEDFLTVGAAGFKLSGVQDAIDDAIEALDVTDDTAVAGQYVAAIEETDGVVAVKTRANVSDAVLNGYAKGTKPASTAIAATDDVKGALAKLEHQIDDAKAVATTEVLEGTDTGNHLSISSGTAADGHTTYTISLDDVASASALTAEIAARKAVDGQTGQTYAANTGATYISGATDLNDADVKLDAALKVVADKVETMTSGAIQTVKVNTVALTEDNDGAVNVAIAADNTAANSENAIVVTTADVNAQNPGAVTLQLGTLDAGFFGD